MNQHRIDQAYMLTIADIASGRDLNQIQREINVNRRELRDDETARGMEEAMIVVQRCGIEYSRTKMEHWIQEKVLDPGGRHMDKFPQQVIRRMIQLRLAIDAPWLHRAVEIPLDITYPDVMRAFAPLPLEHDIDRHIRDLNYKSGEFDRQLEEREKWVGVVRHELEKQLKRLVEMHDPKGGVLPPNLVR